MKKAMAALILFLIETLLFYLYEMPLEAWAYSSVFILLCNLTEYMTKRTF